MMERLVITLLAGTLAAGCGSRSTDRQNDGWNDPDTPEDPTDAEQEEVPPAPCEGTESVSLEFTEDGTPVEGVAVALDCGGDVEEATSGADGRVSFDGLNISERPVDVTFVHEDRATTWLAYGGERSAPEVIEIDLTQTDPQEGWLSFEGDVVYHEAGSIVLVSGPLGVTAARGGDPYERRAPESGTDLPIAFLEYTASSGTATPIGFTRTTFDTPSTGARGPDADADPSATFSDVGVTLTYDLAAGSPLAGRQVAEDGPTYFTRPWFGLYLHDVYEEAGGPDVDYNVQVGLTTSWVKGSTTDDLVLSYVPAAISGRAMAGLLVTDHDGYWFSSTSTGWPIAEGSTIAVRDVPALPRADVSVSLGMTDEIDVAYPEWAGVVAVTLYLSTGFGALNSEALWSVLVPPEGATFSFDELPLASSVDVADILPAGTTAPQIFLSVGAIEVEGDPFEGYRGWVEEGWWDDRFVGRSVDGRMRFEP